MAGEAALLVSSIIRVARAQVSEPGGVSAIAYLTNINIEAAKSVLAGDVFCTAISGEGGSSSHLRGITAKDLVTLTEVCLQRLEWEEANPGESLPAPGSVSYLDHGCRPANFG